MHKRFAALRWSSPAEELAVPIGYAAFVLGAALMFFVVVLFAFAWWLITGKAARGFILFRGLGALLLVWFAAVELWFSMRVMREFSTREPMQRAWRLIAFSAASNLAMIVIVQVLSAESVLNTLAYATPWSSSTADGIRLWGLFVGKAFRFGLLASGLLWVLTVYRSSGFLARLAVIDWLALAIAAAFGAGEAKDMAVVFAGGTSPNSRVIMVWTANLILVFLLVEGLLLRRSVTQMGKGLINRCWNSFSIGIVLVTLGDIVIWAGNRRIIPWPWSSFEWYVWVPAAAAFAVGPIFQLEAICYAHRSSNAGRENRL